MQSKKRHAGLRRGRKLSFRIHARESSFRGDPAGHTEFVLQDGVSLVPQSWLEIWEQGREPLPHSLLPPLQSTLAQGKNDK